MRALARGCSWQEMLDSGRVASIAEIAVYEGIEKVRVQKMRRLARLAPDVVEDIARGQQPAGCGWSFSSAIRCRMTGTSSGARWITWR